MNQEVNELEKIADIKRAAITRAEQEGWVVGLDDCQVYAMPTPPKVINEIGLGTSTVALPTTNWIVYMAPKAPPNKCTASLYVIVEFSWGTFSAMSFKSTV